MFFLNTQSPPLRPLTGRGKGRGEDVGEIKDGDREKERGKIYMIIARDRSNKILTAALFFLHTQLPPPHPLTRRKKREERMLEKKKIGREGKRKR